MGRHHQSTDRVCTDITLVINSECMQWVFLRCWSLIARLYRHHSCYQQRVYAVGFLAVLESHCTRELVSQNDSRRDRPYITCQCLGWVKESMLRYSRVEY